MARSLTRSFGFAALGAPLLMALALSACGDDDDAADGSEVLVQPSSYVTATSIAAATTLAGGAPAGEPGDTSPTEQTYEVQGGDFLFGIASDYGLEAEEIATYNNWAEGIEHPLNPGDSVRIPPGADIPSADDEETDTTEEDSGSSDDEETDTTEEDSSSGDEELCPDGEVQGHYTIKDTDLTRVGVADRLNVTVAQLDDANANTDGYSGFYPGLVIRVPCGGDEAADTTEG